MQRWYRYNSLLYVRRGMLDRLSPEARQYALADDTPIANYWPVRERMQQAIIRCLPVPVVDRLARWRAASYAK